MLEPFKTGVEFFRGLHCYIMLCKPLKWEGAFRVLQLGILLHSGLIILSGNPNRGLAIFLGVIRHKRQIEAGFPLGTGFRVLGRSPLS